MRKVKPLRASQRLSLALVIRQFIQKEIVVMMIMILLVLIAIATLIRSEKDSRCARWNLSAVSAPPVCGRRLALIMITMIVMRIVIIIHIHIHIYIYIYVCVYVGMYK